MGFLSGIQKVCVSVCVCLCVRMMLTEMPSCLPSLTTFFAWLGFSFPPPPAEWIFRWVFLGCCQKYVQPFLWRVCSKVSVKFTIMPQNRQPPQTSYVWVCMYVESIIDTDFIQNHLYPKKTHRCTYIHTYKDLCTYIAACVETVSTYLPSSPLRMYVRTSVRVSLNIFCCWCCYL